MHRSMRVVKPPPRRHRATAQHTFLITLCNPRHRAEVLWSPRCLQLHDRCCVAAQVVESAPETLRGSADATLLAEFFSARLADWWAPTAICLGWELPTLTLIPQQ